MIEELLAWTRGHAGLLTTLGVVSVVMAVATPLLLPWWVASLPEDYFVAPSVRDRPLRLRVRAALATVLGGALVVAGIAMLFLPGQGVLAILVGISLAHFPGKRRLVRRLLRRPQLARSLQWMRRRAGRPPLHLPTGEAS